MQIKDERVCNKKNTQFLVKWHGWPDVYNTWENTDSLPMAAVNAYLLEVISAYATDERRPPTVLFDVVHCCLQKMVNTKMPSESKGTSRPEVRQKHAGQTPDIDFSAERDIDFSADPEEPIDMTGASPARQTKRKRAGNVHTETFDTDIPAPSTVSL
jgi:hypothetical protein